MTAIEYTGPVGRVTAVRGQPSRRRPTASTQRRSGESVYLRERRRHELAAERQRHPDAAVFGLVVPYGVALDNQRGDRIMFTRDTSWLIDTPFVPLLLEHGGTLLGVAPVVEERDGLHVVDGVINAASREAVGDRRYLSVGLGEHHCRQRADGVLEVIDAELAEVSLVRVAGWPAHCAASIVQRAAS